MELRTFCIGLLMIVGFFLLVLFWTTHSISRVVVHKSYQDKSCLRVDDPQHQYSCSHLPEKYHTAWDIE